MLGVCDGRLCMCDWLTEPHHQRVKKRLQKCLSGAEFIDVESLSMHGANDWNNNIDKSFNSLNVLRTAKWQLDEYFAGRLQNFDLPLLLVGTDFQKAVWRELLSIPYSKKVSYKQLAESAGMSQAVRAIANAVGANALSIFVPCHRVVGNDGTLTGYAGGLQAKKYLLEIEHSQMRIVFH